MLLTELHICRVFMGFEQRQFPHWTRRVRPFRKGVRDPRQMLSTVLWNTFGVDGHLIHNSTWRTRKITTITTKPVC